MKAFLETNVLLDWLLEDRPCKDQAKIIISAAEEGCFNLTLSTQSIIDAAYSSRKAGGSFDSFKKALVYLLSFVNIVGIDNVDLLWAIEHYSGDFEDNMQYASAYNAVCDFYITRDKALLGLNDALNPMKVISPEDFVAQMMEK